MSGICPECGYNYLKDLETLAEEAIAAKDAEIERLKKLVSKMEQDAAFLRCLESAGVADDWPGYELAKLVFREVYGAEYTHQEGSE